MIDIDADETIKDVLAAAIEHADLGILTIDVNFKLCSWNHWVEKHYPPLTKDDLGKNFFEVFKVQQNTRLGLAVNMALKQRQSTLISYAFNPYPIPLTRKNGGKVIQRITVRSIEDKKGERYGIVEIIDMTSAAEREKYLLETKSLLADQQAKLFAASKLSSLGEMAAGVAHEINNPLAIIQLSTRRLKKAISEVTIDRNDLIDKIDTIAQTTRRIVSIIKGMRKIAGTEDQEVPILNVSLAEVVNETLGICRERFKYHGIKLKVDTIPQVLIQCRSVQTSQVLLNILNNAFDAVQSVTDGNRQRQVSISFPTNEEFVHICIKDTGPGIPAKIKEKIMMPFFTTKPTGKGTGLGLSIAKGIMDDQGGELTLDEKSQHTCFIMKLKLANKALHEAS